MSLRAVTLAALLALSGCGETLAHYCSNVSAEDCQAEQQRRYIANEQAIQFLAIASQSAANMQAASQPIYYQQRPQNCMYHQVGAFVQGSCY